MPTPPDVVLPAQFFFHAPTTPERRLMVAVLTDAVQTWEKSAGRCERCGRPPLDPVDEWFASDDESWPFAFLSICHELGFEPGYIRSGIARLQRTAPDDCRCRLILPPAPLRSASAGGSEAYDVS
jgi:hypothetical protein